MSRFYWTISDSDRAKVNEAATMQIIDSLKHQSAEARKQLSVFKLKPVERLMLYRGMDAQAWQSIAQTDLNAVKEMLKDYAGLIQPKEAVA